MKDNTPQEPAPTPGPGHESADDPAVQHGPGGIGEAGATGGGGQRNGSTGAGERHGVVEIDLPSRVDLVAVVRMVVAAATNAVEALEGDRLDDLRWVTSEATTNAIQANLQASGEGRVQITCEVEDGVVRLSVRDEGPGMPEHYEVPDITHPDRLLIEGAFGVPLMERLSSACRFISAATGTTVNMELYQ